MPARTQDEDFLSTLPDTSKTGVPYTSTGKTRGRHTAQDGDFLASLPDTTDFTINPSREGTYSMQNSQSKKVKVPYSSVGRASKSGYEMVDADRARYLRDAAADPHRAEGVDLLPGVTVVGRNIRGEPILGPQGPPASTGSAARRFLRSAAEAITGPVVGMWHAATEPARTEAEREILADPWAGRVGLFANRIVAQPMQHEAQQAREEFNAGNYALAAGHGLAAALPMIGPAAAGTAERMAAQYASGDIAGMLGTGAGTAATYALPEGLARVAKSEWLTRSIPHGQITRLIRPMAADLKFGKDPAAAILQEKLVGNNLEQLGDRVYDRLHEVGKQIDVEARKPVNAAKTVDVSSALRPLDDAMRDAAQAGDGGLFGKLQAVRDEVSYNWKPFRRANGTVILRKTGPRNMRMSPFEALTFKRQIGDRIRWTQDPLEGATNKALGDVYGQVKDAVNNAVPGLARLNERYSNLVGAGKAIERRLPIEARNAHWSLSDIVIGTHSIPLAVARHVARWPGVRSRVAAGLYALPGKVPKRPALMAAPATGAAASAEEDRRRKLGGQP